MSTRFILTSESAQFKTTVFPELGQSSDASGARKYLGFDAATDEGAYWTAVVPQGWTGTGTAVITYSMASATSGNVIADVTIEAVTSADGTPNLASAESLDTANTSSATAVPGTAGLMSQLSITLTNADSIAVADMVRFLVRRVGSNGSDTAAGDMLIYAVEIRDAA